MNMHSDFAMELHRQAVERRKRMGMIQAPRPVVVPMQAPAPAPVQEARVYRPRKKGAKAINARPDLATRLYRHPLTMRSYLQEAGLPPGSRLLPGKFAALFDVSAFQPVNIGANQRLTPRMLFTAILPGCPACCTLSALESRNRQAIVAHARQIAVFAMMRGFGISSAETGRRFGINHSTALYSAEKVQKLIDDGVIPDPLPFLTASLVSLAAE